jgi:hypothetical protein
LSGIFQEKATLVKSQGWCGHHTARMFVNCFVQGWAQTEQRSCINRYSTSELQG